MVRIPMFLWSDVMEGAPKEPCSAFIVDGKVKEEIYVSKYLNVSRYGRGYSLPGRNPAAMYQRDEMKELCAKKGRGWHLMSNAEYMALAWWCRKNGTYPHGNTLSGCDVYFPHEHATRVYMGFFKGHTMDMHMWPSLTGTGPSTWTHDGTPFGVTDLIGNLWDTLAGMRLMNGEINIIPDNDSAMNVDESTDSPYWKAILPDGSLVPPGTPGTYKFDALTPGLETEDFVDLHNGVVLSTEIKYPHYTGHDPDITHRAYTLGRVEDIVAAPGAEPNLLIKQIGMFPVNHMQRKPVIFMRNYGERMLAKGGSWFDRETASMFELYMREDRKWIAQDIGFRACWVDLDA